MILETLALGPFQANCYLVGDSESHQALVIDPGAEIEKIWDKVSRHNLQVEQIVLTHAHGDHLGAVSELLERTAAELLLHKDDHPLLVDPGQNGSANYGYPISINSPVHFLDEGDLVECGQIKLKVLHTPGHTPGGICLYGDRLLFTGDTLFYGSIGRTDFSYSSLQQILQSIGDKLLSLEDDIKIYPGHGPSSTLGWEKQYNPFLQPSFLYQYRART